MVTNQSVEALPGIAGVRWYEIRRTGGTYSVFQQGTYAPNDGVHRWMGSIAMDKNGNMALGYSVVERRRTSFRESATPAGSRTIPPARCPRAKASSSTAPESQTHDWLPLGRLHLMNVDPTDDCTFWYVNEYLRSSHHPSWQRFRPASAASSCLAANRR